jgi:hypothetical protein
MKKSSKVFWIGIGFLFLVIFIMAIPFRALNAAQKVLGNDKPVSKLSTVEPFETINIQGNFYVTLIPGAPPRVSMTADENVMPYIQMDVSKKALNLGTESGVVIIASESQKAVVTTNTVKEINAIGNNRIEAKKIKEESLVLNLTGDENVTLAGEVKTLTVNLFGNSVVYAKDLKADNIKINGTGNFDVTVSASKTLIATASGKGDIKYYGNPQVSRTAFGFVTIQKMNDTKK